MSEKKKTIYVLDHKITFKTFKLLQKRCVQDSGPKPEEFEKILWEMLRDKQIYCYFSNDMAGDMAIDLKLPKNVIIKVISSPKNEKTNNFGDKKFCA